MMTVSDFLFLGGIACALTMLFAGWVCFCFWWHFDHQENIK